jgi:hypothetical protein
MFRILESLEAPTKPIAGQLHRIKYMDGSSVTYCYMGNEWKSMECSTSLTLHATNLNSVLCDPDSLCVENIYLTADAIDGTLSKVEKGTVVFYIDTETMSRVYLYHAGTKYIDVSELYEHAQNYSLFES